MKKNQKIFRHVWRVGFYFWVVLSLLTFSVSFMSWVMEVEDSPLDHSLIALKWFVLGYIGFLLLYWKDFSPFPNLTWKNVWNKLTRRSTN